MEAKWITEKHSLLNVYLAKLNEALCFVNKAKEIFNINISSQQTQNPKT